MADHVFEFASQHNIVGESFALLCWSAHLHRDTEAPRSLSARFQYIVDCGVYKTMLSMEPLCASGWIRGLLAGELANIIIDLHPEDIDVARPKLLADIAAIVTSLKSYSKNCLKDVVDDFDRPTC